MKPETKGTAPEVQTDDKKMVEKVNQQLSHEEDSFMARIIGLGLILLGVVFVVLAVVVVFLSRRTAQIDEALESPDFNAVRYTNEEEVRVVGEAKPDTDIMFFVDGEEIDTVLTTDEEGKFDDYVPVGSDEATYELQAATVEGFPLRKRSKKTDVVEVVVDKTAPSTDVELDYDPVSEGETFSIKGTADPEVIVKLTDGEAEYLTSTAADGTFEMEGIKLTNADNSFKVVLTDLAGNEKELAKKVDVKYTNFVAEVVEPDATEEGDLNGDGVTTVVTDAPDLPEAAGEFDAAMDIIMGNQIMFAFGIVAIAVFSVNSGLVVMKAGKRN